MNGEQLKKAQAIFEEVVDLPASQRGPILDERCGDDEELRTFVEQLLASHNQGLGDFLQTPEIEITRLFKGRRTRRDGPSE
ncbi:MAG: hypothetical protein ACYSWT_09865 [Planctomycetota bacterium]|jgi:hypothetical protein